MNHDGVIHFDSDTSTDFRNHILATLNTSDFIEAEHTDGEYVVNEI